MSLLQDHSVSYSRFSEKLGNYQRHINSNFLSPQCLYSCQEFYQADLLCVVLEIFPDIPHSFQVLHCQITTTEEELRLFLKRVQTVRGHYIVVEVNKLAFKLEVSVNKILLI